MMVLKLFCSSGFFYKISCDSLNIFTVNDVSGISKIALVTLLLTTLSFESLSADLVMFKVVLFSLEKINLTKLGMCDNTLFVLLTRYRLLHSNFISKDFIEVVLRNKKECRFFVLT